MNFIYRAQLNLLKKKGRTLSMILMGMLFFIVIFGSAMIENQSLQLINNTKQTAAQYLVLSSSKTTLPQDKKLVTAKLATIKKISQLNGIATYSKSLAVSAKIKASKISKDITILGASNTSQFGTKIKLTAGKLITSKQKNKSVILISDKLSKTLKVKVGSKIIFLANNNKKITAKIVGTYAATAQGDSIIYTNYQTANALNSNKKVVTNAIFKLNKLDYQKKQQLSKKINQLLVKEKLVVERSTSVLQLKKLNSIQQKAHLFYQVLVMVAIILVIIGTIIVFLQREQELQMLLILGASRRNILLQLIIELTVILLISSYAAVLVVTSLRGRIFAILDLNHSVVMLNNTFSQVGLVKNSIPNLIDVTGSTPNMLVNVLIVAGQITAVLWACSVIVLKVKFLSYRLKKIF